jgi:DHA2 family lincomycin resistance protein-like MFS transporter
MYLQGALLLTSVAAGLVLLPGGLINGLLSPVAGVLFDKFGPKTLVTPGLVLVILSLGLFSQLSASTSVAYVVTLHVMMLIGISMVMMPAQTTGLNQLPKQLYPHGTAIMNTLQQVSGAIGTALFVSIMSSGKESYLKGVNEPNAALAQVNGLISGLQQAFFIAALVGAIALVLSFFLKRTQAPENSSTGVPIK